MIKKLKNNDGVAKSSTLAGQRELLREYRNKINEIIDLVNRKDEVYVYTTKGKICNIKSETK